MLKSTPEWEAFERDWIRKEPKGYMANVEMVNALVEHVEAMGRAPLREDPLAGFDDDIRLRRALDVSLRLR
jgi:hypothetical protein